jgi:hypothetical protein
LMLVVLGGGSAWSSDVIVEAGGSLIAPTPQNPRTGAGSVSGVAELSLGETWMVSTSLQYTRDLGTTTSEASAPGSDLFLLGLGATFTPNDHWLSALTFSGSPPTTQQNATNFSTGAGKSADVVLSSANWSLGATWLGSYATAGDSKWESTVDLFASATFFSVFQQASLPSTARSQAFTTFCSTASGRRSSSCALLTGVSASLLQGRVGAAYTATLWQAVNVGLEASAYLYSQDPATVGSFSLVALRNTTVGAGVPVLPLHVTIKPSVFVPLGAFTVGAWYQLGVLADAEGLNHLFGLKVSWKASKWLRVWVSATTQFDAEASGVANLSGGALIGTQVRW